MTRSAPWFKLDCRAWLDATRNLPPDVRGLYIDVLALIYDRDGPVPDDDRWIAHQLHISARKWRIARNVLVACGKLTVREGQLTNSRAEIEIEQRAKIRRTNAENAAKRGRNSDENPETAGKNNASDERTGQRNEGYARGRQSQSQDQEEESDLSYQDGGGDGGAGAYAHGARINSPMWRYHELMWLEAAIPKYARDNRELRSWLAALELTYGAEAVTAAIAKAKPRVEAGEAHNVQGYITGIIKNIPRPSTGGRAHGGLQ